MRSIKRLTYLLIRFLRSLLRFENTHVGLHSPLTYTGVHACFQNRVRGLALQGHLRSSILAPIERLPIGPQ